MKKTRRFAAVCAAAALLLTGCGSDVYTSADKDTLTYDEAKEELSAILKKVSLRDGGDPVLDIYSDETAEADALADIDTFEVTVRGTGDINIEIAAATELSSEAPDDWINIVAKNFNKQGFTVDGKSVSVSVRAITSGEALTYIKAGAYEPQVYIPSAYFWGDMLKSSGVGITKIEDRLVGNTAGLLIRSDVYETFIEKYKDATIANALETSIAGDIILAYPNPYTSTTGLNGVTAALKAFDPDNPLSDTAAEKLLEYQKTTPPVAYTTAVLRNQAAKGVINAMLMEEQAYVNTPELTDYEYIPFGVRHDHPVYTFDWCSKEEQEAAKLFAEYCLSDEMQALADEKGFNRHEDYMSDDPGLSGSGYLTAQSIWKESKNGGKPIIAVFVADVSGSMAGEPLNSLKSSLISASSYISSDNYIGLVSYSSDVAVELPIAKFDASQRAYFTGEVKSLTDGGKTATYDAVLVALDMLLKAQEDVPDAKLMLFVLSDGEQNTGYKLSRITPVVEGLNIPVVTIAYNYDSSEALTELSGVNEAAALSANSEDIVNQLRNLFNVEM